MPKAATQKKNSDAGVKVKAAGIKEPALGADAVTPKAPPKATRKKAKAADKPAAKPSFSEKPKKLKMVRDSFTMPEAEYKVLGEVKRACLQAGIEVKKSELLRVGVELIRRTEVAKLKDILSILTPLKVGRPKKEK